MFLKKIQEYLKNSTEHKYNNLIEAARWASVVRRLSGTSILELVSRPGNQIVARFSLIGFFFFILWNSIYIYSAFVTYYYDQTILRMLYNTKLQRYGDDFESISIMIYVMINVFLTPFRLNGNVYTMQKIVNIDMVIEKVGHRVDYFKLARTVFCLSLVQMFIYCIRTICLYFVLSSTMVLPLGRMFQLVYSDTLAVITTSLYCYYMVTLRNRFKWINNTLREIKNRNSWEYKVFVRGTKVPANMVKVVELQDKQVCEKIKTCARVYSELFKACKITNRMFGLSLFFTMMHYFNYIILYLFYFMEATASGLFHDLNRYFDFLVYVFWEIAIAVGIIFLIVGFSESTVAHAKKASYTIHDIINEDFSPTINSEAMQFSIQLLHEMPLFTVCGFYKLDYAFIDQIARSVATYLVILLQFVTESPQPK